MSEPVYSRAPGVVWRLGPDRVLVRRIGAHGDDAAADLLGEAALVWIALDEPLPDERLWELIDDAAGSIEPLVERFAADLARGVDSVVQPRAVGIEVEMIRTQRAA